MPEEAPTDRELLVSIQASLTGLVANFADLKGTNESLAREFRLMTMTINIVIGDAHSLSRRLALAETRISVLEESIRRPP